MKSLGDYISDISNSISETDMKPMHIIAEQNDGEDALWNTTADRWSRRAKHQLNRKTVAIDEINWQHGDIAMYEGQQVEVTIPNGPNATVGIMLNGVTKMIRESSLVKIDEGVMGGLQPLNPLNRMMQLAGISTPTIMEPSADITEELIEESSPFDALHSQMKTKYQRKSSPDGAASLAVIGTMLVMIKDQIENLKDSLPGDEFKKVETMLTAILPMGATLLQMANSLPESNN